MCVFGHSGRTQRSVCVMDDSSKAFVTSAKISQACAQTRAHPGQAAGFADGRKCSADITGCLGFFGEVFVLVAARGVDSVSVSV